MMRAEAVQGHLVETPSGYTPYKGVKRGVVDYLQGIHITSTSPQDTSLHS